MKINEIKKVNESKIYKIMYHAHVKCLLYGPILGHNTKTSNFTILILSQVLHLSHWVSKMK